MFLFIGYLNTVAQKICIPPRTSRDSCRAQEHDKNDTLYTPNLHFKETWEFNPVYWSSRWLNYLGTFLINIAHCWYRDTRIFIRINMVNELTPENCQGRSLPIYIGDEKFNDHPVSQTETSQAAALWITTKCTRHGIRSRKYNLCLCRTLMHNIFNSDAWYTVIKTVKFLPST